MSGYNMGMSAPMMTMGLMEVQQQQHVQQHMTAAPAGGVMQVPRFEDWPSTRGGGTGRYSTIELMTRWGMGSPHCKCLRNRCNTGNVASINNLHTSVVEADLLSCLLLSWPHQGGADESNEAYAAGPRWYDATADDDGAGPR